MPIPWAPPVVGTLCQATHHTVPSPGTPAGQHALLRTTCRRCGGMPERALPPRHRCQQRVHLAMWPPGHVASWHLTPTRLRLTSNGIQTPNQGDPLPWVRGPSSLVGLSWMTFLGSSWTQPGNRRWAGTAGPIAPPHLGPVTQMALATVHQVGPRNRGPWLVYLRSQVLGRVHIPVLSAYSLVDGHGLVSARGLWPLASTSPYT